MAEGFDQSRLRITDADRDRVADVLRDAAGAGRLAPDELDERLNGAYAAKTYADLRPLLEDLPPDERLPAPLGPARTPVGPGAPTGVTLPKSVAVMTSCKRRGSWTVPPTHTAVAVMGDVLLDLREATLSARVTTINAHAVMGEVKVIVDEFTEVVLEGTPIMGDFTQRPDKVAAEIGHDSPVVRVRGTSLMGEVSVQRRPPPGLPRRFLGRYWPHP